MRIPLLRTVGLINLISNLTDSDSESSNSKVKLVSGRFNWSSSSSELNKMNISDFTLSKPFSKSLKSP